ncbi:hypothetical protein BC629DRAFT_1594942 [Irpex lacteus]|nr:hypothetical protein BC629DRAFT_1594942 [Irpex lacteus]
MTGMRRRCGRSSPTVSSTATTTIPSSTSYPSPSPASLTHRSTRRTPSFSLRDEFATGRAVHWHLGAISNDFPLASVNRAIPSPSFGAESVGVEFPSPPEPKVAFLAVEPTERRVRSWIRSIRADFADVGHRADTRSLPLCADTWIPFPEPTSHTEPSVYFEPTCT